MAISNKYFHDHFVMLLLSVNIFLAAGASIFMLVSLSSGHSNGYIVQCRDCSNPAAVSRFTNGSVSELISFVAFALIVLTAHVMLSLKAYQIHRQLAISILSLGILLLLLTVIVGNSLLVLR